MYLVNVLNVFIDLSQSYKYASRWFEMYYNVVKIPDYKK